MRFIQWPVLAVLLAVLAVPTAAQVLVDENFDSYADDDALYAVWEPYSDPLGRPLSPGEIGYDAGILTTDTVEYPGLQGQGVDHIGGAVNQYLPSLGPSGVILPTADQNIVLAGDILDNGEFSGAGNRSTIGLRFSGGANILELGSYNGQVEQYAWRVILWEETGPSWNYFELDPLFDSEADVNLVPDPFDIQVYANANGLNMWHRWQAEISETQVTLTLDLFRDGLTNDPLDYANSTSGVDATAVVEISPRADGFDRLRIGGASSVTSSRESVFDNILLMLADVGPAFEADFDEDGDVDGDDFLLWQGGYPTPSDAVKRDGDYDNDGDVDGDDFLGWQTEYPSPGSGAGSGAVPEPASWLLLVIGCLGSVARRRR